MGKKRIDLREQQFGRLTVIEPAETKKGRTMWKCLCSCGKETIVKSEHLKSGHTKSCGCYHIEGNRITHGQSGTRIYNIWFGMRNRCFLPTAISYRNYGGRGIVVCDEWKNDFAKFYDWSIENGYNDNLSIERIDNNGNYEPSNCKWATRNEQMNNKRNNHYLTINGVTKTVTEWSKETGIKKATIMQRIKLGHCGSALIRPVRRMV